MTKTKAVAEATDDLQLFDVEKSQSVMFERTDDEGRYEFEFSTSEDALSDAALAEFDKLQNVKIDSDEQGEQSFSVDDLQACGWFFDKFINLASGYDEDEGLPDDWQSFFSIDEKQAVVKTLLGADAITSEDSDSKVVKKFSFTKAKARKTIKLRVFYDGDEIETSFAMPFKADRDIKRYRRATSKMVMKKGLSGTFLPETWQTLGSIFDDMSIEVAGYAENAVPLHHKAVVLREFFETTVQAMGKKQKS